MTTEGKFSRRTSLTALVAGFAAAAGLGVAWFQLREGYSAPSQAEIGFWSLTLKQLDGSDLPMSHLSGKPLLLNFWATWCPPCVEELPLLSDFFLQNKAKSWQVLGIAVDQKAPVARFVSQMPLSFPVVLGGASGLSLSQSLGNSQGGLPFSVLFTAQGKVIRHKIGKLTVSDLEAWKQAIEALD